MQRIKAYGGDVTPAQLRAMATLAETFTPGYPLHLTTRQDVELHGLRAADVPAVQRGIAAAGLTTVGACGDTLRNVTVCTGNGQCEGSRDMAPLAEAIRVALESLPCIRSLPRKFKICLSGCAKACAKPWINDLAFVAREDGALSVVGAGSLGARPNTGIALYESVSPAEAVALSVAAVRLFDAEGDRKTRSRARLRHVRERLADEPFRQRLDDAFRQESVGASHAAPPLPRVASAGRRQARLQLPLGDIAPAAARALAEAVERAEGTIRIGFEHDLWIHGEKALGLPPELAQWAGGPRVVACPATTWCKCGIADARAVAEQVRAALAGRDDLNVCISGCPNNCAHASVADIGLIGRVKTIKGVRTECFRVQAGGGRGVSAGLGRDVHAAVPADQIADVVAWVAEQFTGRQAEAETFAAFVEGEHESLVRELAGRVEGTQQE